MGYNSDDIKTMAENYAKAWCSLSPEAVASFYAPDGQITINKGEAIKGRDAIKDMVSGFYAEFPDLAVLCDEVRTSADHAIFIWTLKDHHSETKNYVKVGGWEEWDLDENMEVKSSLGWFDAVEYERQIAEGI